MSNIPRPKIVTIHSLGPMGPPGPQGPRGFSGSVPPFFIIQGTSKYYTTSSLVLLSSISSSIFPSATTSSYVSTYSLGKTTAAWKSLYIGTGSIKFVNNNSIVAELNSNKNEISIGFSTITTQSFGFTNNPIIIRNNNIIKIRGTGSIHLNTTSSNSFKIKNHNNEASVIIDNERRFILGNLKTLPNPITGSIVYSLGDFYFGY